MIPENATNAAYRASLEEMARDGLCPLDPDQYFTRTGGDERVLQQMGGWILARNRAPYPNTEQDREGVVGHMIAFPERHVEKVKDLTEADRLTYWEIIEYAQKNYGAVPAAVIMRLGEGNIGAIGGTIAHLHFHILVPHLDPATGHVPGYGTPNVERVVVRIG